MIEGNEMHIILLTAVLSIVPTNMEMAEDALEMAVQELPEQLGVYGAETVFVEIEGDHTANWFIEQTVISVLHDSGIDVIDRDYAQGSGMLLRIRPMELVVEYGDVSRPWIVGSKRVERIAKCELSSSLMDEEGELLMSLRTSGIQQDVVSWADAEMLSGSSEWDWLSAELPENSGGGLLEPIVVTGVVASLVYLFYSSRAE
jgi:hypothetical protein